MINGIDDFKYPLIEKEFEKNPESIWISPPTLHHAELFQPDVEHPDMQLPEEGTLIEQGEQAEGESYSAHRQTIPLSFVSLPQLDYLTVTDGLQLACVSCPVFALMFPLLAEHVEMSGGTVNYDDEYAG